MPRRETWYLIALAAVLGACNAGDGITVRNEGPDSDSLPPTDTTPPVTSNTLLYSDDFSGTLSNWVERGDGEWSINSAGELIGNYDIGCGAPSCAQAQLLLIDSRQPGSGNWRMEIKSGLVEAYCCYNGGAIINAAKFVLWISDSHKETLEAGSSWQGTSAPATTASVSVGHLSFPWTQVAAPTVSVPVWSPASWQTVALEKRGDQYTLFFNGTQVYQVTRSFSVPPKIGVNTYGGVRMDQFRLHRLP